ncbi:thioredoxin family protein [Streptomyces sp. NPDC004959]|uniref:thioredoxin family protein n=1 Tax=unclassified Streptomyces TaxID=2593676 RepID=UPI0004C8C4C0|nr:thioredoxin family protein [Streptomyces sp. NRRL F-5630]
MAREGGARHVREREGENVAETGTPGSRAGEREATADGLALDWTRLFGSGALGDAGLGERATLVQFSTAFCQPCRATRRVLDQVAGLVPGVAHVEIDAEDHLALVRAAGIDATPTVLFLDAKGHEVRRASGAPRRDQVLAALAGML